MTRFNSPEPKTPDYELLILQVIRGELPFADLFQLGIKMGLMDDEWHIEAPFLPQVKIKISDVAYGLLKYSSSPIDQENGQDLYWRLAH